MFCQCKNRPLNVKIDHCIQITDSFLGVDITSAVCSLKRITSLLKNRHSEPAEESQ